MTINVAILGTGMMGQEHISYILGYDDLKIKYLCDPNSDSLRTALSLISSELKPEVFTHEKDLLLRVEDIDLLVIATPNYLHTPQLIRWGSHPINILVEKPVAISEKQTQALRAAKESLEANIWVAMEYRYIPAVQKLIQHLPEIGEVKKITIRENRYPFLSKIQEWNKDIQKSGDTLVEKCCHFFDLFRLLSGAEMDHCTTKVHRGLLNQEYGYDHKNEGQIPIIDSAYVLLDMSPTESFRNGDSKVDNDSSGTSQILGCLELCMFAEGSRHQEEIIVTGMKGRIEAYLPENKVFLYQRPSFCDWTDRTKPPPAAARKEQIFNCSDLQTVYPFAEEIPQHKGYHYCSTSIEWKYLIEAIKASRITSKFQPHVSLDDGIRAVEMGIVATRNITNKSENTGQRIIAFSSQSSECLLDLALAYRLSKTLKTRDR